MQELKSTYEFIKAELNLAVSKLVDSLPEYDDVTYLKDKIGVLVSVINDFEHVNNVISKLDDMSKKCEAING